MKNGKVNSALIYYQIKDLVMYYHLTITLSIYCKENIQKYL